MVVNLAQNKVRAAGIAILAMVAFASAQLKTTEGPYGPQVDYESYSQPTVFSIAPVSFLPDRPPRIQVRIQHGHYQYIGSAKSSRMVKAAGIEVGVRVSLRHESQFLYVRASGHRRWLKLRLVSADYSANL
ncbi:MAG TPA: hypothetical protein VGF08_05330 [Terriglobales bacterium]|jgi:hypothetical protein